MNDLAALSWWIVTCESYKEDSVVASDDITVEAADALRPIIRTVLDPAQSEHDAQMMLEWILKVHMEVQRPPVAKDKEPEITVRCNYIQDNLLSSVNKELQFWLKNNEVVPQLFLLRQVRCMLTREFHMDDVLLLWDAIFSKAQDMPAELLAPKQVPMDYSFWYLDWICISMIV